MTPRGGFRRFPRFRAVYHAAHASPPDGGGAGGERGGAAFFVRARASASGVRSRPPAAPRRARLLVAAGARSGSEGSPLFDTAGRLIGIVIAHANRMDGGFAVPAAEIAAALRPR